MTFTFKLARRLAQCHILSALALACLAASCAPGKPIEGGLEPPPDDVIAVHLVPDSVSLNPTEFVDFTVIAEMQDGSNGVVSVTWQTQGGTITPAGRYTAGNSAGVYRVIAQYQGGPADTATVVVTVTNPPPPVLTRIDVTPVTVAMLPAATQQFSAAGRLSDGSSTNVAVNWSATGGSIDGSGLFTAPTVAGTYLVVANSQTGGFSDTSLVSVAVPPPTLAAVILTPASASMEFGQTRQFSAVGQLTDGSSTSIAVTWLSTGGTVNGTGLYTAGNTAGTFRVIARAANGLADTSSISLSAPTISTISVTPVSVTLQSGQTQQFTVSATLSNGGTQTNPSVTWVATGGAINTSGLYTAGATAGGFRVIASSANGHADTSTVTITTPTVTAITLTPPSASVAPSQTLQFSASATLSNGGTQANPTVTWSATGGSITTSGRYTAGTTPGAFRVIATSTSSGVADTSAVTITASTPTVTAIVVTPPSATVALGQTQQFTASATMSDGSTQASPSVTWTATGGTVTSNGLYTAGTTAGIFRVIATGSGKADTSAITIPAASIVSLAISPGSAALQTGQTQPFSVSATLSNGGTQSNPSVTWTATGGSITSGGLYTAGSSAGSFQVIATAANGVVDTSAVTLTAATITAIVVTPSGVTLTPSATQQFSASATLSSGGTQPNTAVTWSATGGTINTTGLYTAGSTTGSFRVIGVQQGGALADTSTVTIAAAPPTTRFFNSTEPGCDGKDANVLWCDDFERGRWFVTTADVTNPVNAGWNGTPFGSADPQGTNFGRCGGEGVGGGCTATNGGHSGVGQARAMADHDLSALTTEIYFRYYVKPLAGVQFGQEKALTFNKGPAGVGGIYFGTMFFNGNSNNTMSDPHFYAVNQGVNLRQNQASPVTLAAGHWFYLELHLKLNGNGSDVVEMWGNDCGTTGICTGTPTLRMRYTDATLRPSGDASSTFASIWLENWANPASVGELYYDQIKVAKVGPIGFKP